MLARDAYGKVSCRAYRDHDDLLVFDADLAEATYVWVSLRGISERFY